MKISSAIFSTMKLTNETASNDVLNVCNGNTTITSALQRISLSIGFITTKETSSGAVYLNDVDGIPNSMLKESSTTICSFWSIYPGQYRVSIVYSSQN